MTLSVIQLFTPVQLPAAVAVLFTLPASPATNVLKNGRARLTNTTAGPIAVTMYADAAATASSAANMFMSAQSIPANSFVDVDIPTMKAGDTLRGFAGSATSVTLFEMGGSVFS